jgi:creatinine amidohydrolase
MSDETSCSRLVGDMSWDRIARGLAAGAAAILPIGAGAKQHGWHMPMRSDAIQAEWLSSRLADTLPALIWPVVNYGHYPAFIDYAGSCSLSVDLFEAVVRELVTSLLDYGAQHVLVVNTGISTIAPIDRALARSGHPERVLHLKVYAGPRYCEVAARLATQAHGGHADELETSVILALAPNLVDMSRATPSAARAPGPGPMQHADPNGANYSASGSIGDPRAATAAKGNALLDAMVEDMTAAVQAWRMAQSTP